MAREAIAEWGSGSGMVSGRSPTRAGQRARLRRVTLKYVFLACRYCSIKIIYLRKKDYDR